jgi:hypothetical protein
MDHDFQLVFPSSVGQTTGDVGMFDGLNVGNRRCVAGCLLGITDCFLFALCEY